MTENMCNHRKSSQYEYEWTSYVSFKLGYKLWTSYTNSEGPKTVGRYSLDAFDPITNIIYEFLG